MAMKFTEIGIDKKTCFEFKFNVGQSSFRVLPSQTEIGLRDDTSCVIDQGFYQGW